MKRKLTIGERHFLRLIRLGEKESTDGWASVSSAIMPLIEKMPMELIIYQNAEDGKWKVKLTEEGNIVLDAILVWLG